MAKKKFQIRVVVTAEIEVEEVVLKAARSKEWRAEFYSFRNQQKVAEHLAYNLLRGATIDQLDGFADRASDDATISKINWDFER